MQATPSLCAAALLAALAGSAAANGTPTTVTTTAVGPVTATITALNYDESGGRVNGFLVGSNTLLSFPKPVCGGVGALGAVGNSVTYSGNQTASSAGVNVVRVSSYTNGTLTYTPATRTPPAAYASTAGTITQLNYSAEGGSVNGFVFTPTTGDKVFVSFDRISSTVAALLTKGAALSVTGTLEAAQPCLPTGTISEVDATSLTINGTTYKLRGGSFGSGGGPLR